MLSIFLGHCLHWSKRGTLGGKVETQCQNGVAFGFTKERKACLTPGKSRFYLPGRLISMRPITSMNCRRAFSNQPNLHISTFHEIVHLKCLNSLPE